MNYTLHSHFESTASQVLKFILGIDPQHDLKFWIQIPLQIQIHARIGLRLWIKEPGGVFWWQKIWMARSHTSDPSKTLHNFLKISIFMRHAYTSVIWDQIFFVTLWYHLSLKIYTYSSYGFFKGARREIHFFHDVFIQAAFQQGIRRYAWQYVRVHTWTKK
jgi:hypothetical protein